MREGWTYRKLGEVGDVITGSTPSTKDENNYNSSDFCFVKPSDIPKQGIGLLNETEFYISKKAYDNSRKLPKGSVLTTCIGIIGKVGILNVDATCNQQINAIIPHSDISSIFLAYSILSKRHYLEHIANAPVVPIINKKEFSNTPIYVPPLAEQERIVAELDLLSSIIEKKKAQLKEYDQLAQSIFYDMFGDPITNEKGWVVKRLEEIVSVRGRVGWKGYKKEDLRESGPLAIGGGHITENGFLDFSSPVYLSKEKFDESPEIIVKQGDLIMVQRGTIGRIGLVRNNIGDATINPCVLILRPQSIMDIYLLHLMLNKNMQSFLEGLVRGVAQPMITQKQVKSIDIPLPPLSLQQEFAAKIEAIEKQKSLIQQSIKETETLFNSRMDYYFN